MFKKFLIVFLISMVPIVELRGAIPVGLSTAFGDPLPVIPLYILCIIGNLLPVPLIFFFARKVLIWGADKKFIGKFFTFCLEKGEKGGQKLLNKAEKNNKKSKNSTATREIFVYLALFLFVGIPIPGTGAWTGTLAASFLDLDFKKSCIAIMAGVVLAGIIMGLASFGIFSAAGAIAK
ncbi:MAG: small multi-drug export protein [Clostridia bacterium]|nr:small multi-drug export protein [Clostridia bacterium]